MVNIWLTMTNDDSRWLLHKFPAHHGGTPKDSPVAPAPVAKEFAHEVSASLGTMTMETNFNNHR